MTEHSSEPSRAARPVRRWAFFVLAVLVGLACIRLGFWQLDRLAGRRAVNAAIRAELDRPEIALPADLGPAVDLEYRTATARGTYDPSHEVILSNRAQDGIAGVHIVTPLLLEDSGPAVLVDRGWMADSDYRRLPPESWAETGPIAVSGILLPSQPEPAIDFLADRLPSDGEPPLREWRALSIEGIRRQVPYSLLDVYLAQQSAAPRPGSPQPSVELDLSEGPHLGYAIQWFAFALIAIVGGVVWIRRAQGRTSS